MSINRVFISGNLTDNCSKHGSSDNPMVMFTVAVNDRVKSDGEWVEKPNFIDCKIFGNYAKALSSSLLKGTRVSVDGQIVQDKWEDKEGNKHSKISIRVNNIEVAKSENTASSKKTKADKSDVGW